eukprot:CAMPEP_0176027110 /NCGR_PEP_ID=MMETSP0120_2-20121206/13291_1 /TAXON_ID=160619 /ORGANISM="Kryptoperidinium foliaceum, Strain CCMP 1326" /LENGTH=1125 /DNA_ID=CAMNT_0017360315 /DNA_START=128 /DNA_END=3503 /DNA_ORIENTATION=-
MEGFFAGLHFVLERLTALTWSACRGCPTRICHQDGSLSHSFDLQMISDNSEAARVTKRARQMLTEGRIEDALRELHEARQMAPDKPEVLANLGCGYHHNGDDASALYWYREAHRRAPFDDVCTSALAALEQRRGSSEGAVRVLLRYLQDADACHVGILRQLAQIHQLEGEWSKAAGCFHRLLAIDPGGAEWSAQLQVCLDQLPRGDARGANRGHDFSYPDSLLPGVWHQAQAANPRRPCQGGALQGGHGTRNLGIGGQHPPAGAKSFGDRGSGLSGGGRGAGASLREAQRQIELGRPAAALEVYQELLRQDGPHTVEALLGLLECKYELGDIEGALEVGQRLLKFNPDSIDVQLRLAELLLSSGRGPDAADPYISRAEQLIARAKRTGGCASSSQQRFLCVQTEAALAREDHNKALAAAAEAVRLDASAPRPLLLLGTARIRVAEYALGPWAAAAKRTSVAIYAQAAQAHERLRQFSQAIEKARQALDQDPRNTMARVVHAMALQQTGQIREAEGELEEASRADPDSALAKLQWGYCLLCLGEGDRAAAILEAVRCVCALQSQLGAAKVYFALATDSSAVVGGGREPDGGRRQSAAEQAIRDSLRLHRNLSHVWGQVEGGELPNPLEAVQRLRGICDLDLTTLQAKQLLRLLARASGRRDLLESMSSLAVPMQCRGNAGGPAGSASSRNTSAPPPNRWAQGTCHDGLRGVLGSGSTTPTSEAVGSRYGRGSGPSTAVSPAPRGFSGDREASSRGSWSRMSGTPGRRPEGLFGGGSGGTPQRGRSPGPAGYDGGFGHGGRMRPSGSRDPRPGPDRADGSQDRHGSQDRSPFGAGNDLAIGWNELIQPEQLVFGPTLGTGGSAQVFRGSWNGQEVAIKKIVGIRHLEEMKKEINALRRLRHPRLVRFIGACLQPPQLLVVTEFMPGGSLHDRLFGMRREPKLAPQHKWNIASQTAEGLEFLHAQRVVHRDLKSMNILLDVQQNAKICDFGLAQEIEATHIVRKLDGEGGSPRYMAPECYDAANGKLTEKVDIWAIGCILIELFGEVLPYADCTSMAQLSARILVDRRPPEPPSGMAPPIASLIQQCVKFEASRRPGATEVRYELAASAAYAASDASAHCWAHHGLAP